MIMKKTINQIVSDYVVSNPSSVNIEPARNGFIITEFRIVENYKTTYVARDLGELAQAIHRIYVGKTEGES